MKIGDLVRVHPRLFVNPKAFDGSDIGIVTKVRNSYSSGNTFVDVRWICDGNTYRYNQNELEIVQAKQ